MAAAWLIGAWLSAIRAATAGHGLYDLDLFAVLVYVADEHPAAHAGVGALEAGVMRLYGVVVVLGGWVRWVRGRLIHGGLLDRLSGPRGVQPPAGPSSLGWCPLHLGLYHL